MPVPLTKDDALARLAVLKRDDAWVSRYRDSGTTSPEFEEMQQLQAAAIGVDASTDAFNPNAPTLSAAAARIAALKKDKAFGQRYRDGGVNSAEYKEMTGLQRIVLAGGQ